MTNKEIALAITQAVQAAEVETAVALVSENYIQHTPSIPDGRRGFKMFLTEIKSNLLPAPKLVTVHVIEDGDFVALHHEISLPKRKAMFEIFRFEDGLAAEHWSAIMDHSEHAASSISMLDGATEIKDLDKTDSNKELVNSLMNEIFIKRNVDNNFVQKFYDPEFIQHIPFRENNFNGLIDSVYSFEKQALNSQIRHIHHLLAQGNFVLAFSEGSYGRDVDKPVAFFDLFRLENDKIIEQWSIVQEVPDTMNHDNGMFQLSLYKRLGGYDGIAAFIDHAFPQVASHPDLQHLFLGHSVATKMRQRQLIIDSLSSSLKGPTIYLGKPLKEIHQGLNITLSQWETFMKIINKAINEKGIKGGTKKDFSDHFESFRSVTVEAELGTG